jgi:hypothetical protein
MSNEELQRRIEVLEQFVRDLQAAHTLPKDFSTAIQSYFENNEISLSTKSATSENRGVNEAGTSNYSVMGTPDGFLEVVVNGIIYYIPYFT